jgi:hypothetical protein
MNETSQLAVTYAVTTAAGFWLVLSGVHKRLLAWRRESHRCPCCGRIARSRVCERCERRS